MKSDTPGLCMNEDVWPDAGMVDSVMRCVCVCTQTVTQGAQVITGARGPRRTRLMNVSGALSVEPVG